MDNSYKVPRGTSFKEFYYRGLSIDKPEELVAYIKANKWYFEKKTPEVRDQFRNYWHFLNNEKKRKMNFLNKR